jgi:hypothetical protein
MLVITDNTPLRYLILLGFADILSALFDRIIIPRTVVTELQHPKTPPVVRAWMAQPPVWVEVHQTTRMADAALATLDAGERDAIVLMQGQSSLVSRNLKEYRMTSEPSPAVVLPSPAYREPPLLPQNPAVREAPPSSR